MYLPSTPALDDATDVPAHAQCELVFAEGEQQEVADDPALGRAVDAGQRAGILQLPRVAGGLALQESSALSGPAISSRASPGSVLKWQLGMMLLVNCGTMIGAPAAVVSSTGKRDGSAIMHAFDVQRDRQAGHD